MTRLGLCLLGKIDGIGCRTGKNAYVSNNINSLVSKQIQNELKELKRLVIKSIKLHIKDLCDNS